MIEKNTRGKSMKIQTSDEAFLMKPKNDYVFKKIFGDERNKDILISFLKAVLKVKINDVNILNGELTKENIDDKKSILDIRVTTDSGINIDVEIQVSRTIYMPQRSLYYWAKIYSEQLDIGEKYNKLKKTVCINIVDFDAINSEKYHTIFKIKEKDENIILTDLLEIHFLEMPKLTGGIEEDELSQWISFIKADSREELEVMAKMNTDIDKAFNILSAMSHDKKARAEYLSREMALHDEATRMEEAIEEGLKKGIQQGKINDILELLEEVGEVPKEIKVEICSQGDIEILKKWLRFAARCESIEEFAKKISG